MRKSADFIQESAPPECMELRPEVHSEISAAAKPNALVGPNTSRPLPSEFYEGTTHPGHCVAGNLLNSGYLLPLVEVVGSNKTATGAVRAAVKMYRSSGMRPLHFLRDVPGTS